MDKSEFGPESKGHSMLAWSFPFSLQLPFFSEFISHWKKDISDVD